MTLEAGTIRRLRVAREVSPYGYFMTDGEQDVILHYTELTRSIEVDEELEVFLFFDTEDRLASTMKKPLITLGEVAPLKVADFHPRLGFFLEMGIGRQLLLPLSALPEFKPLWPQLGDHVYVKLMHDKEGRLVAKLAAEEDLAELVFHAPQSWLNTWQEAVVYRALRKGTFMIIKGGVLGFGALGLLHESERPKPLRVGEQVRVRITHVREDGRVNVTLAERKEIGMDQDAFKLFGFLKERPNGAMPYSDETPADILKERFQMSKSAFKRAIGRLMKAGYCTQEGNWTKLTEQGAAVDLEQAVETIRKIQSEQRKPEREAKPAREGNPSVGGYKRPQGGTGQGQRRTGPGTTRAGGQSGRGHVPSVDRSPGQGGMKPESRPSAGKRRPQQ